MNYRSFLLLGTVLLVLCTSAAADTIPGGDVSGTWYAANSPYFITGDITIPSNDTLTVEPSVMVNFLGGHKMTVNGLLEAVGTETDSIHFFSEDTVAGWGGIDIENTTAMSHLLSYCTFSHSSIGLLSGWMELSADISHCLFRRNVYAMYLAPSSITGLRITDCVFRDNGPAPYGAAAYIWVTTGPIEITRCLFENNAASEGGGAIYVSMLFGDTITISDCTFLGNAANFKGGAIGAGDVLNPASVVVKGCTFAGNTATGFLPEHGGGAIWGTDVYDFDISRCCFYDNQAYWGDAISISPESSPGDCHFKLDHCTFRGRWAQHIVYGSGNTLSTLDVSNCIFTRGAYAIANSVNLAVTIEYSDLHDNTNDIADPPAGFGVLDSVNYNGDSCDVYFNIFMDPMFEDTANSNYHLLAGSPCIDAGDPLYQYDPDSTITDIGRYFFDQRAPHIQLADSLLDFGTVTVGDSADLELVIYNLGNGGLLLSDISNGLAVFRADWSPLDTLIPPFDSLKVNITFTPDDTVAFEDTLWIDNNDTLSYVLLLGTGAAAPGITEGHSFGDAPGSFALEVKGSNPCNSSAVLQFALPKAACVDLTIYDVTGRKVTSLVHGRHAAGVHEATLDLSRIPSGVYLCHLDAGEFKDTEKIMVAR